MTQLGVAFDVEGGTLTVGEQSASCDNDDNDDVLRTYLQLVNEQRDIPVGTATTLRREDIAVLAELLDLEDRELEAKLITALRLSAPEASELRRQLMRQRMAFAALGLGLLSGIPLAGGQAQASADPPPTPTSDVEIGHAVTFERDPTFVPPPGVEIGDAMVIRRR